MNFTRKVETRWGTEVQITAQGYMAIVAAVLGVIFLFVLFFSIKKVNPGEAAVITSFGRMKGVRTEGVRLALFEGYTRYNLKTKKLDGHHEAGSKNGQYIFVDTSFSYNLKAQDLPNLYKEVGSQKDLEEKFIHPVIRDVVYQATAQYSADDILPRQGEFRELVIKLLKERLDQRYFDMVDLQITNIDFSPEYNAALEQKQIAEQTAIKEKQIAEQNSAKQKIEIEQNLRQKNYELEAAKVDAERQRLLTESLTPTLLQKAWIEKWNGVLPVTMTGADSNFILPLK